MRDAKANCNPRHASYRLNNPNKLRRAECSAIGVEARRKISNADGIAFVVDQLGYDDCRVSHILRARFDLPLEHYVGEPLLLAAGEEPAEYRIAVVTRQAPPHDSRGRIDQRRSSAIANDGKIQPLICHAAACPFAASMLKASRTCAGFVKMPASPGK